jgi:hypothetical protein
LRAVSPLGGVGFRPAKVANPEGGFPPLSKLFKTNQNTNFISRDVPEERLLFLHNQQNSGGTSLQEL